jgi:metal-responsive CopG/Arc/MetJ family transcriptional regulator
MPIRTTVYFNEKLLAAYDKHIHPVKRSTAISELMRNDIIQGGGTVD